MSELPAIGRILQRAAVGEPPPPDGGWSRESAWTSNVFGVVTFTGHAVFCVPDSVTDAELNALQPDGFGGAADPRVILSLAGTDGWIDSLDVVLAAPGAGGQPRLLVPRPDLAGRPRAQRAAALRTGLRVYGAADHDDAVLTIGAGVGGLPELSFELAPSVRGAGFGRQLIADAQALVQPGETLLVSVAPGNVASLRATLAAGFRPIAGVQLFRPGAGRG